MSVLLKDLEALSDETLSFATATASASDISQLLAWGARREAIFARLQNADLELQPTEEESATKLIRQILELDVTIIARLKNELRVLENEIIATNKMRQLLKTQAGSSAPVLLQRVA